MTNEERIVERYRREKREKANAELCVRLSKPRSFAEMLAEFSALDGLMPRRREAYFFENAVPNV